MFVRLSGRIIRLFTHVHESNVYDVKQHRTLSVKFPGISNVYDVSKFDLGVLCDILVILRGVCGMFTTFLHTLPHFLTSSGQCGTIS